MREWVTNEAGMADRDTVLLDGLDEAIVGITIDDWGAHTVYDEGRIIGILKVRDGMDEEGAREFFYYNIDDLRRLEGGPIFMTMPGVP